MKKKPPISPRKVAPKHFPYKHPTFGTVKTPKPEKYWRETIYYCWWAYLKRNEQYLEVCRNNGNADSPEMSKVYRDFGDVRSDDFKQWWSEGERGATLFADRDTNSLRVLKRDEVDAISSDVLLVGVPMNLPVKYLLERFKQVLDVHHKGERGFQYAKQSNALYRFKGQPNIRGLLTSLKVYDFVKANPRSKQWEVGRILPQFQMELEECDRKGIEPEFLLKRNIEATVSRHKRKANEYIENVGRGNFLRGD